MEDTKEFLSNYHELAGMLEQIKKSELGMVNETLNDLRHKTEEFLDEYDKDKNKTIDISELVDKRERLAADLRNENKGQLGDIISAIENLEREVISYRQGILGEETKIQTNQKKVSDELSKREDHQTIDLDEHFEKKTEIPPKGQS